MANGHDVLGQTEISHHHIHIQAPPGQGAKGTHSVHPQAHAGLAQPRHMPPASQPAPRGAKRQIGFLSAATRPTLKLLKGFSSFALERGEGRFKDTPACLVYSREKTRKSLPKTTAVMYSSNVHTQSDGGSTGKNNKKLAYREIH